LLSSLKDDVREYETCWNSCWSPMGIMGMCTGAHVVTRMIGPCHR
jgi:hypothetical protein